MPEFFVLGHGIYFSPSAFRDHLANFLQQNQTQNAVLTSQVGHAEYAEMLAFHNNSRQTLMINEHNDWVQKKLQERQQWVQQKTAEWTLANQQLPLHVQAVVQQYLPQMTQTWLHQWDTTFQLQNQAWVQHQQAQLLKKARFYTYGLRDMRFTPAVAGQPDFGPYVQSFFYGGKGTGARYMCHFDAARRAMDLNIPLNNQQALAQLAKSVFFFTVGLPLHRFN